MVCNSPAFFPLQLQTPCTIGRHDLSHSIGDSNIRFSWKRMMQINLNRFQEDEKWNFRDKIDVVQVGD
jgi:hypothetical protein